MEVIKTLWKEGQQIATVVVDANGEGDNQNQRFQELFRKFSEKKVFPIVVFIADNYDWTFDAAKVFGNESGNTFGKWAWFVATSKKEANEIADSIQSIVDVNGLINLDANDVKTILYSSKHGNGLGSVNKRACFACGEDAKGNFEVALSNAIDYAKKRGQDIYDYNKVLISIDYNSNLLTEQMNSLNKFMDRLAEKHENDLEIKWGVAMRQDLPERTVRITMLAK